MPARSWSQRNHRRRPKASRRLSGCCVTPIHGRLAMVQLKRALFALELEARQSDALPGGSLRICQGPSGGGATRTGPASQHRRLCEKRSLFGARGRRWSAAQGPQSAAGSCASRIFAARWEGTDALWVAREAPPAPTCGTGALAPWIGVPTVEQRELTSAHKKSPVRGLGANRLESPRCRKPE
jgi:hypothetical protein